MRNNHRATINLSDDLNPSKKSHLHLVEHGYLIISRVNNFSKKNWVQQDIRLGYEGAIPVHLLKLLEDDLGINLKMRYFYD